MNEFIFVSFFDDVNDKQSSLGNFLYVKLPSFFIESEPPKKDTTLL